MASRRTAGLCALLAGAVAFALVGCGQNNQTQGSGGSSQVTLNETGSTLLYPLFNVWVPTYTREHKNVKISTAGTGSGTGISDAANGTVQIGASDAFMPNAEMMATPGMLNIPLAISAQQVMYNVPGLNKQHLNLSGAVLAGIYTGKIVKWNDPAIAKINPGVSLPSLPIVPIHRADGSGDTFLFSQYLSFANPQTWGGPHGPQYGTTVGWPSVQGSLSATGNAGMIDALSQTSGGIAYVGISYLQRAVQEGLGYAALQDRAGSFVLPTGTTIGAAAAAGVSRTPKDERVSLIDEPGANAYPIVNYEYAIVKQNQPNAGTAAALQAFLKWALTKGNASTYLSKVQFLPLPPSIVRLSEAQIAKVH